MKSRKSGWILVAVVIGILLLALLSRLGIFKSDKVEKVAVEKAEKRKLVESVLAGGKIYPLQEIKVSAPDNGEVVFLAVQEGDKLNKGQHIATIKTTSIQGMMGGVALPAMQLPQVNSGETDHSEMRKMAEKVLDQATSEYYNRQKELAEGKITEEEFKTVETFYKQAQKTYQETLKQLRNTNVQKVSGPKLTTSREQTKLVKIFAPMSGTVSALFVQKGDRVTPMNGNTLMNISNNDKMKVEVEVGENDVIKIKTGDSTKITMDAFGDYEFSGKVVNISQFRNSNALAEQMGTQMNNVSRYKISIEMNPGSYSNLMEDYEGELPFRSGMSANAEIFTRERENVLTVPINAVTTREDELEKENQNDFIKEYVFIDSNHYAVLREVRTGLQDNKYVEIKKGLKGGEKVIVAPYGAIARTLKAKDKIKIVDKQALFEGK